MGSFNRHNKFHLLVVIDEPQLYEFSEDSNEWQESRRTIIAVKHIEESGPWRVRGSDKYLCNLAGMIYTGFIVHFGI